MSERALLQPGTRDSSSRLLSYLLSPSREEDQEYRKIEGNMSSV